MGSALTTTRLDLQRVATHVLARRRHAVSGRFGLRATPGGIGTPAFGSPDALEVVRTAGTSLVHELGGQLRVVPMAGATLADLAALVDVDLRRGLHRWQGHARPRRCRCSAPPRRRRGRRSVGLVRPRLASARHRRAHRGIPRTDPALARALRRQLPARGRPRPRRSLRRRCVARRRPPRGAVPVRGPVGDPPSGRRDLLERAPLAPCSHGRPSRRWLTPSPSTARAWTASPPEHRASCDR